MPRSLWAVPLLPRTVVRFCGADVVPCVVLPLPRTVVRFCCVAEELLCRVVVFCVLEVVPCVLLREVLPLPRTVVRFCCVAEELLCRVVVPFCAAELLLVEEELRVRESVERVCASAPDGAANRTAARTAESAEVINVFIIKEF